MITVVIVLEIDMIVIARNRMVPFLTLWDYNLPTFTDMFLYVIYISTKTSHTHTHTHTHTHIHTVD
jgi:hypothetical protein